MNETTKALTRRLRDPVWKTHYMVGDAIDIGAGPDGLSKQMEHWPGLKSVRDWDRKDGDATYMKGVPDESYDLVHSSHCLEHINECSKALRNWWRLVKPGGHLVVVVPDDEMYEQGVWPSTFNPDHKWLFTPINVYTTMPPQTRSVVSLVRWLDPELTTRRRGGTDLLELRRLHSTFDPSGPRRDQTLGDAECAIEFVVRKRP